MSENFGVPQDKPRLPQGGSALVHPFQRKKQMLIEVFGELKARGVDANTAAIVAERLLRERK